MQKLLNFKGLLLAALLMVQNIAIMAQSKWVQAITPDFVGAQYAGSIGHTSVGMGYELFKHTVIHMNYGHVSEKKGGKMHILALKFEYQPFKIPVGEHIVIQPFNPGVFLSYTLAKELSFKFESPQYPKNYYFWSEALRKHLSANSEIKLLNPNKNNWPRVISMYIEANTNDIYMVSWFENRTTIPFTDIFKLGYGLRVYF